MTNDFPSLYKTSKKDCNKRFMNPNRRYPRDCFRLY